MDYRNESSESSDREDFGLEVALGERTAHALIESSVI